MDMGIRRPGEPVPALRRELRSGPANSRDRISTPTAQRGCPRRSRTGLQLKRHSGETLMEIIQGDFDEEIF